MTSGGNNFNAFPENQLTKFRVLSQIGTTHSFVLSKEGGPFSVRTIGDLSNK